MSVNIPSTLAVNPTLEQVGIQGNGQLSARKITATTTKQSITIPTKFSTFILKNAGANVIRINFNADTNAQYFTLAAGATLPPITVNDKVTINFITATGTSELEAILWG
jgi:hypothetical protein